MVEGALTFPLMALVTLALVNLALAGFSATTANHAAGYGARAGSVAQVDPAGRALEAAQQALQKRHRRLRRSRGRRHLSRRRRARGGGLGGAQLLRQPDAALRRASSGPLQGHGRQRVPQGGLVRRLSIADFGLPIVSRLRGTRSAMKSNRKSAIVNRQWLLGRRGDMVWNALVIVTVLLPLAGLAIDVPRYFALRSRLQIAADAGAEAAARAVDIRALHQHGRDSPGA